MELTVIEAPVKLTDNAIEAANRIREEESIPADHFLRVGVKGGGCSGMSYVLAFDEAGENDQKFEINGLEMIMDKRHAIYLMGMEVDFHDGLNARGFVFNNPNATDSCGCGVSFSA